MLIKGLFSLIVFFLVGRSVTPGGLKLAANIP